MKIKIIIISIFASLLSSLIIYELVYTTNSLQIINLNSNTIINYLVSGEEDQIIIDEIQSTYDKWKNTEYNLCFIYNHKDLLEIGKELNQALSYVKDNNNDEAYIHMCLLQEDLQALQQIVSFDLCNIF